MSIEVAIKLSSTIVLMRETDAGPEFLLAKKSDQVSFLPNYWVFPGGAVDPEDECEKELATFKAAAIRETQEEVSIDISTLALLPFAHWITPKISPKRFSTYFFLTSLPLNVSEQVQVDGGELVESAWFNASDAIALHRSGKAQMLPPTLISLLRLSLFTSVADILSYDWNSELQVIEPKAKFFNQRLTMLYPGDAAFESEIDCEGARHRCVEIDGVWEFYDDRGNH